MSYREELAKRYGFSSFAELLDTSKPLTSQATDNGQTYIARRPNGTWFVWDDVPSQELPDEKGNRSDTSEDCRGKSGNCRSRTDVNQ